MSDEEDFTDDDDDDMIVQPATVMAMIGVRLLRAGCMGGGGWAVAAGCLDVPSRCKFAFPFTDSVGPGSHSINPPATTGLQPLLLQECMQDLAAE